MNETAPVVLSPVLEKLRCLTCNATGLSAKPDGSSVYCQTCAVESPVRQGRFPDFLSSQERAALAREILFWNTHFGDTTYADESEASYRHWALMMDTKPTDEVIELGCGSGALLNHLPAKLKVGLEPAESLLTATKGFVGVIGTAARMPFASKSFDLVFFKHSLHHVEDKTAAMIEAARITKSGGRLIVMEPNALHPQRRLISSPKSVFRKLKLFTRLIGPVETFQAAAELIAQANAMGLTLENLTYTQSAYEKLSYRQFLQKVYARVLKPFVPQKYLMPNYFLAFRKR